MHKSLRLAWLSVCLWSTLAWAAVDLGFDDDSDLTRFITRPDIKVPLFNVTKHDPDSIAPGYWFVAPYARILQESHAQHYYQPCQTGPSIYDGNGDLIWAGACQFANQNTCDLRSYEINGSYYLSAILYAYNSESPGRAVVLDNTYGVISDVQSLLLDNEFNMHEYNVLNNRSALHVINRSKRIDLGALDKGISAGWVMDFGIREVDIVTEETLFEWWALDHISPAQSVTNFTTDDVKGPWPRSWNWMHINSVEKNTNGDYMFSARYTNAIYKISGADGSVMWQLGGTNSSFVLDGFNFSRQHDARWMETDGEREVITLLDNARDDSSTTTPTSDYSSALIVELDKRSMVARVLQRYPRPDHGWSMARGNFQTLPNGNKFLGWSDNCYITEHAHDGRLVFEAQFSSLRFVTYRTYKFPFVGRPKTLPDMSATAYGPSLAQSTTVVHVSWNGATEVAYWVFYRNDTREAVGAERRTGFETAVHLPGYIQSVYAAALASDGSLLGVSSVKRVARPSHWVRAEKDQAGTQDTSHSDAEERTFRAEL